MCGASPGDEPGSVGGAENTETTAASSQQFEAKTRVRPVYPAAMGEKLQKIGKMRTREIP